MFDRGDKLFPYKLTGLWKLVYNSKNESINLDCYTMKLNKDNKNDTMFEALIGYRNLSSENSNKFLY